VKTQGINPLTRGQWVTVALSVHRVPEFIGAPSLLGIAVEHHGRGGNNQCGRVGGVNNLSSFSDQLSKLSIDAGPKGFYVWFIADLVSGDHTLTARNNRLNVIAPVLHILGH